MDYSAVLFLHIAGAFLTALVALAALTALFVRKSDWYTKLAIALAMAATFEVISGTTVAILSPSVTVASVCGNIALYLLAVAFIETLLFARMRGESLKFPTIPIVSPITASVGFLIAALALGL